MPCLANKKAQPEFNGLVCEVLHDNPGNNFEAANDIFLSCSTNIAKKLGGSWKVYACIDIYLHVFNHIIIDI